MLIVFCFFYNLLIVKLLLRSNTKATEILYILRQNLTSVVNRPERSHEASIDTEYKIPLGVTNSV